MNMRAEMIDADAYWARVEQREGCWGWRGFVDGKGYGRLNIQGMKPRSQGAHRVSWALHYGEVPAGAHVLHNCDNPLCTNPAHLRLGTHADNMRDMKERGRARGGCGPAEQCWNRKLTWADVRKIRAMKRDNPAMSYAQIAAHFPQITQHNVGAIIRGETWPDPESVEEMRR